MSLDEGYVKYLSDWRAGPAPDAEAARLLDRWRRPLRERGLIGYDESQSVGYGNLSVRFGPAGQFIISGTQTGALDKTLPRHYALVTGCDIAANRVTSVGPVPPSSEAMTHAALYAVDSRINAVVHVHDARLWQRLRYRLPTTGESVAYGTPEMAEAFRRLYAETPFASDGVAAMAGHENGLVAIGSTVREAARRMLNLLTTSR